MSKVDQALEPQLRPSLRLDSPRDDLASPHGIDGREAITFCIDESNGAEASLSPGHRVIPLTIHALQEAAEDRAPAAPIGELGIPVMPAPARRRRALLVAAAVLSLALHASSLLAFLQWHTAADLGAISAPSEAISVEILESKVLEAMLHKQSPEPPPSVEATATQEGSVDAKPAARQKSPVQVKEVETPAPAPPVPQPEAVDDETRVIQEAPSKTVEVAPLPRESPDEPRDLEKSEEVVAKKPEVPPEDSARREEEQKAKRKNLDKESQRKEEERKQQAQANSRAGGVTSRGSAGSGAGVQRASASTGSMLQYAAGVRARVARNKPSGRGLRGTAVVAFGVTIEGGLAYASVARSSGTPRLDQAALAAVAGAAPFGTPPTGAAETQLQFSIPFHFR